RYKNLTRLAFQYSPELVAIFIDVTLNNIVIASYHGYYPTNREFIDAVNRQFVNPAPVFEYGNLPNINEQHYLNDISRRT
ncbi:26866_t:CDS:1, partial [Gigaspora margarita]